MWRYSVILHTNYRPAQQASFSRFLHLHWLRLKLLLETSLLPEWQTLCVTGNNTDRTKVSHISTEKDQNKTNEDKIYLTPSRTQFSLGSKGCGERQPGHRGAFEPTL